MIKGAQRKLILKPKLASLPRLSVLPLIKVRINKKDDDFSAHGTCAPSWTHRVCVFVCVCVCGGWGWGGGGGGGRMLN